MKLVFRETIIWPLEGGVFPQKLRAGPSERSF